MPFLVAAVCSLSLAAALRSLNTSLRGAQNISAPQKSHVSFVSVIYTAEFCFWAHLSCFSSQRSRALFMTCCVGLVPESPGQMAEEGAHSEEPRSSSAQRPPAHVQRGAHSSGRTLAARAWKTGTEVAPTCGRAHARWARRTAMSDRTRFRRQWDNCWRRLR